MADLEKLVVKLQLEANQMKSELGAVKKQLGDVGGAAGKATGPVKGMGGALGGVGKAMAVVGGAAAAVGIIVDLTKAAADDNMAQALLARQLEATTGATSTQIAEVEKQVGALEMMSGVADDQIRPSLAGLVRATGDTTKALQLQKLALDVSAATGKDVGAVSHAMAKAVNGNETALTRMIPALKGNKDQFGYLMKNFDGAAKKAADVNPYKRLGVAMDTMKESLGRGLMPIMEVFADMMVKISPIIDVLGQVFKKILDPVMKLVGVIIDALMPPLSELMDVFNELMDEIMPPLSELIQTVLVPALKIVGEWLKFLMIPIKIIVGLLAERLKFAIQIVTAILKPLITWIKHLWDSLAPLRKQLQVVFNIMGQVAHQIQEKLMKVFKHLWEFITKFIKPLWDGLMKAMKPLVDFIKNAFVNAIKNLMAFLKPLWNFIKPMIDAIAKMLGIKIDMKAAMKVDDSDVEKATKKAAKNAKLSGSFAAFGGANGSGGGGGGGGSKTTHHHKHTHIKTSVTAKTDAKPTDIAANIVNAIKFNLPVLGAGGTGVLNVGMGSQIGGGGSTSGMAGFGGSGIGVTA